ncbi:MAG TPA: alpha/beta hydrolase [Stellaceae bacterium]|jgi:pimeloyl-ACP methyl ester carboxylesterase
MNLADGKSTIEVNGIALEVETRGSGKPLLFLHPEIGLDHAGPALDALAKGARVIAPLAPAYGKPPMPGSFNSIDDIAYLYLDLLEALDLKDLPVVGLGIGGWIAAEIAVKSTQRLSKLVLTGAFGVKHGDRETRDIFDMWFVSDADLQKVLYLDPQFATRDLAKLSEDELYAIARAREASSRYGWRPYMHDPKLKSRLHRIKIPALVLWGAEDRIVAPAYGRAYAAALPQARFAAIENSGHFPHIEQPQDFARQVLAFIEGKSA